MISLDNATGDFSLYLAFVLATCILMLIPGPNVALIVANSVAYGTRFGLLTMAGTSSAMVVQLVITALGMTAVLGFLGLWFEWLRWTGVVYLVYLGIRGILAKRAQLRNRLSGGLLIGAGVGLALAARKK
jgi:threonine/homoserine/homoserine lactone efflux protein